MRDQTGCVEIRRAGAGQKQATGARQRQRQHGHSRSCRCAADAGERCAADVAYTAMVMVPIARGPAWLQQVCSTHTSMAVAEVPSRAMAWHRPRRAEGTWRIRSLRALDTVGGEEGKGSIRWNDAI